jgi:hypothetical protein
MPMNMGRILIAVVAAALGASGCVGNNTETSPSTTDATAAIAAPRTTESPSTGIDNRESTPRIDGWRDYQGVGWSIRHPPDAVVRPPPGHSGAATALDTTLLVLDESTCVVSITPFTNPRSLSATDYVTELLERSAAESGVNGLPPMRVDSRRNLSLPNATAHELVHISAAGMEITTYVVFESLGLALQPHCTAGSDAEAALSVVRGLSATAGAAG